MSQIIFCGGGSGGHVMPAVTLLNSLKSNSEFSFVYFGSRNGIEREIISELNLEYKTITTGKLRRYLSFQNFVDIFKVAFGILEAFVKLLQFSNKNCVVFSTGGFVSVPVVIGAWLQGKKILIHEQTSHVGLANKICAKFADEVLVSFKKSLDYFPKSKTTLTGYPLREELYSKEVQSSLFNGKNLLESGKPIIFVTGGGNGSKLINDKVKEELDAIKEKYVIIHQVGKNFIEEFSQFEDDNYFPSAFIGKELIDLYKISNIVISRAGAGTVCELIALQKPSIFVPLKIAQMNEQFHNAKEAEDLVGSLVVEEDDFREDTLLNIIHRFESNSIPLADSNKNHNGTKKITEKIDFYLNSK